MGAVLVQRADYVAAVATLRDRPMAIATERRPVARLAT